MVQELLHLWKKTFLGSLSISRPPAVLFGRLSAAEAPGVHVVEAGAPDFLTGPILGRGGGSYLRTLVKKPTRNLPGNSRKPTVQQLYAYPMATINLRHIDIQSIVGRLFRNM